MGSARGQNLREVARLSVRVILATALLVAVGCGSGDPGADAPATSARATTSPSSSSSPPILADDALPGYVVHRSDLDVSSLARDALEPAALASLLDDAGFVGGTEARFTARREALIEVVARVLRFGDPSGAAAYLAWFERHAADLLGSETQPARVPRAVPDGVAFAHGVCGGCTKDTFQYVVAWTRGPYAITLRVGGPAAGPRAADPLAARLDERVTTGG
jgi:hypothetical protein